MHLDCDTKPLLLLFCRNGCVTMACTATSAVIDLAAATAKVDDGSCNAESVQMSDLGAKQTGSEDTQVCAISIPPYFLKK